MISSAAPLKTASSISCGDCSAIFSFSAYAPFTNLTETPFLIKIFNLSGFAAGVLLIQSSMPSAILCYLVASMYSPKNIVDNISSMIVVSTIMSLITVPITVFISLKYFN